MSFSNDCSSSELENIGHDLLFVAPVNCVVTFAKAEHGRIFLQSVANAVLKDSKCIRVLNPSVKYVVLSGNRAHIDALVRADANVSKFAFQN